MKKLSEHGQTFTETATFPNNVTISTNLVDRRIKMKKIVCVFRFLDITVFEYLLQALFKTRSSKIGRIFTALKRIFLKTDSCLALMKSKRFV